MKKDFSKVLRATLMPILVVAALCLVSTNTFAITQTVTPDFHACTQTGNFTIGEGLLVLQEIGHAPITCTIGTVVAGTVAIFDPPSVDGGELSDVLSFVSLGNGTSTATLYSAGEIGLPSGPYNVSITEDNSGHFPYTLYDPECGCGPGNLSLSFGDAGTLTVAGITDNAYVVVSNTDEIAAVPETSTTLLLGFSSVGLLGLGGIRRKLV